MHYRFAQKQPKQTTNAQKHTAAVAMITMTTLSVMNGINKQTKIQKVIVHRATKCSVQ
jgi:hypothetical protein